MHIGLTKKITIIFILISLTISQTGLIYAGSFLSPKKALAGVVPDPQGTISLKKGWNLISPSDETLSSTYLSGCRIASGPWEWNSALFKYQKVTTLKPLNAYWVRVDEDCSLSVGSTGQGNRSEKSTTLKAGWNLVSSTTNYNWNQFKGTCQLDVNWLFEATGSDYKMLVPAANLEPFRGYWVKVKSACTITEPVVNFSVENLLGIDSSFNCYLSQGSPSDTCDLARIIEENGTEYCRYYNNATCQKNSSGYYQWSCGEPKKDPRPGENYQCTEKGWKENPTDQSDQEALKLDLCNITSSIISSLLGSFAKDFSGEVIVGLFGEDIAKKVQGLVDFYFWLQAKGINIQQAISDPDYFAENLNKFIDLGVSALKGVAANVVKDFIVNFSLTLKLDPGVAQELGNFSAYLVKNGQELGNILSSPASIGNFLLQYAQESASPVLQKLVQAEKLVNFIKTGLSIDTFASTTKSQIIQAVNSLTSDTINRFKREMGLSDQEINNIVGFVRYLVDSRNLSLKDIIQKTKADIQSLWQSYASANGITLQKGIEIIQNVAYDIAAEAVNKLIDIVKLNVPDVDGDTIQKAIDSQLVEKTIRLLKYYLFDKGLSLADLSVEVDGTGFSASLSSAGITIDIDSQVFIKNAVKFVSQQAYSFLKNELKINPDLSKYIIDFANYAISTGGNLNGFLNFNPSQFISSFRSYLESRGRAILTQIATDFVAPFIEESLGIDPKLIAEIARFAKFLTETKNISLESLTSYAKDQIENLVLEFTAKAVEKLTGIRYDILHRVFKIVVNQNLIQDIVHLDLISIVKKLLITVEINGNFACPTDLVSAVCTLLNANNWEDCSIGSLNPLPVSSPPHTVRLYDQDIRPASIGVCSVPNIYISILGEPIIQGINFKVGPIAYRGTKLRIDMPTTNQIDWKDASKKDSLYRASWGDGLSHSYSSGGSKNISANCRFWLNIDILSFHWPTVSQNASKTISVP